MNDLHMISIALHIGAPETDNDQMTWSLRKDSVGLYEHGVMIRRPGTYRRTVARMVEKQISGHATAAERQDLLHWLVKNQPITRLILSGNGFMGVPAWMLAGGRLFHNAGRNTRALADLFAHNRRAFFLGIRNPATLIPAVFRSQATRTWEEFLDGADLTGLRWSNVLRDIRRHNPDCPLTVWANEETPIIWPQVLRRVAGLDPTFRFAGELDIIRQVLREPAGDRMAAFLDDHAELSETQRALVRSEFLDRFHKRSAVEQEFDLPGWSQDLIDTLTGLYNEDLATIADMDGVRFVPPPPIR